MKIRVVGSPLFSDTFNALGANPTQMSWADAQPALASGAVDGQENPMFLFTILKMHQVGQKFVTTWGYVTDPLIFVVNKEVWSSWTPADQKIVREAAVEAGKQEIAIARKGLVEADKPLFKEVAGLGVTVDEPDAGRTRRVRQGDASGLQQVEDHDWCRPGQYRREVDRRAQEIGRLQFCVWGLAMASPFFWSRWRRPRLSANSSSPANIRLALSDSSCCLSMMRGRSGCSGLISRMAQR